jgi:hypothetical protein
MSALGSYYVWSSLGAPDGLHFRLDLTQPEQREVAREVVKVGCGLTRCSCRCGCGCADATASCVHISHVHGFVVYSQWGAGFWGDSSW